MIWQYLEKGTNWGFNVGNQILAAHFGRGSAQRDKPRGRSPGGRAKKKLGLSPRRKRLAPGIGFLLLLLSEQGSSSRPGGHEAAKGASSRQGNVVEGQTVELQGGRRA